MWYKAQKDRKYALNSKLQALQIFTNDDEVESWSLSSFLLAVPKSFPVIIEGSTTSIQKLMEVILDNWQEAYMIMNVE